MDVIKSRKGSLFAVAFTFVFAACSNKTTSSVFPEGDGALSSTACVGQNTGQPIENKFVVQWEDGKFSVETAANAEVFKETFIKPQLEKIKFVEFDRVIHTNERATEVSQSGLGDSWGQNMVGAPALWSQGIYGQGITVAVVDAFVDTSHPQIQPRIAVNSGEIPGNGIDDDRNGIVDDYYGASFVSNPGTNTTVNPHGTHVAGIIAADHTTGPVKGMAPQAKIIPAQFISNDGNGSLGDAVLALQYAANRGAKIINSSWGGAPCVASLRDEFALLNSKGILLLVAAGNDGLDIDYNPDFPAAFNFSNQITVAAATANDFMAAWSNSGFGLVHLAAPGSNILSTIPNNQTAYFDGTSMATPFVSGAAALLWSAKPNATAAQIKSAILQSVDVTSGHEYKVSSRGRLNVQKALEKLKQLVP